MITIGNKAPPSTVQQYSKHKRQKWHTNNHEKCLRTKRAIEKQPRPRIYYRRKPQSPKLCTQKKEEKKNTVPAGERRAGKRRCRRRPSRRTQTGRRQRRGRRGRKCRPTQTPPPPPLPSPPPRRWHKRRRWRPKKTARGKWRDGGGGGWGVGVGVAIGIFATFLLSLPLSLCFSVRGRRR